MRVRGRRQCTDCGHEWSYFETGEVACPDCGSLRSVGTGERQRHTDNPVELDLTPHRNELDSVSDLGDVADDLKATLREYIRKRGFVSGGDLRTVDDTILAAAELLHAVDVFDRTRKPTDTMHLYVLELLRGADSDERPAPDAVPESMTDARGLAYAEIIEDFCSDLGTWLDDHPDPAAERVHETLKTHVKRVNAVYGDVPLSESEALVRAARDIAANLVENDEAALATAEDRLSRLE
ncbi:MAG: zinc ribbon domain-containing protein [Halobellus sp.]|uniref:zinc ribbon domain-containing protein n=1 Tax=Halobellus sp. TaxID=1979212 RepID=UPI0035D461E0